MRQNVARSQRSRRLSALLVGLIQMAGCTHPSPPAIPALSPLPGGVTAASPRVSGAVGSPDALPPAQVIFGREQEPSPQPSNPTPGAGDISLDFADTDIREVVAQILVTI